MSNKTKDLYVGLQGRLDAAGNHLKNATAELQSMSKETDDLAQSTAWSAKGPWRISHTPGVRIALNNGYFDALGLPRLDSRVGI